MLFGETQDLPLGFAQWSTKEVDRIGHNKDKENLTLSTKIFACNA